MADIIKWCEPLDSLFRKSVSQSVNWFVS